MMGKLAGAVAIPALFLVCSPAAQAAQNAIEMIVVTAQKRAQDAQDVPISIEVIQSEQLQDYQIRDFRTLQNYVPNLLVQATPGNDQIFIRGFGSQATNFAADQSVSLYVDGVYGGRNRQFMAPFFDVERIEVMRGPQGALLGKNTAAGALSIVTASPTEAFEAEVSAFYGLSRDGIDVTGYLSGPLSDTVKGRLAFQYTDFDGYVKNTGTGRREPTRDNVLMRGTLLFTPTDAVDATLKVEYADFETSGTHAIQTAPVGPRLDDEKFAPDPLGVREADEQDSVNASLTVNVGWGDHTITSITGWSRFEDDKTVGGAASPAENWLSTFHEEFDQFSQEVRLASPVDGQFEYIVGGYFDTADYDQFTQSTYDEFLGIPVLVGQMHHEFSQTARTWSGFALGTWHAAERLRVLGSARYTRSTKKGDFQQFVDFGTPLGAPMHLRDRIKESNTDPSLTLQYDVAEGVMVYAAYGAGSKAGGFSAQRLVTAETFVFDKETSRNLELGLKGALANRTLLFSVALYDLSFDDLQVSVFDPTLPGYITSNAAEASSRGVEGSFTWLPMAGLQFDGSVAYQNAEYDDFPGAACLAPPLAPPGCTPATNNLKGVRLPGASKWTGNLGFSYELPVTDGLKLGVSSRAYYRSKFASSTDQSPEYGVQDGYTKLDARAALSSLDDRWAVAIMGRNLTNKLTQSFSYLWPGSGVPRAAQFLDETRTVALEARVRF